MLHRYAFEAELDNLKDHLRKMGEAAGEMLSLTAEVLFQRNEELVKRIVGPLEDTVDGLELELGNDAAVLLATQSPMASDLRFITSALRLATDLERLGDYCVDIAKASLKLEPSGLNTVWEELRPLPGLLQLMLETAMQSFLELEVSLAEHVGKLDKDVDRRYKRLKRLIIGAVERDPACAQTAVELVLVARYFERIGDHLVNVAEHTLYTVEGRSRQLLRREAPEDGVIHQDKPER